MVESIRCYLCGLEVIGVPSNDHVPPRQFYSREIRIRHAPNLFTLPTHPLCNSAYQLDEEYFLHALSPVASGSYSGRSLFEELTAQYTAGRNVPLGHRIFSEFDKRPSGLVLPSGRIVKRFDPARVWRVIWKIVRGLFYREMAQVLPEDTPRFYQLVNPGDKPPIEFFSLPPDAHGDYPGVLDYRYRKFVEANDMHLWALLFWDRIIALVAFHDPTCKCERCTQA